MPVGSRPSEGADPWTWAAEDGAPVSAGARARAQATHRSRQLYTSSKRREKISNTMSSSEAITLLMAKAYVTSLTLVIVPAGSGATEKELRPICPPPPLAAGLTRSEHNRAVLYSVERRMERPSTKMRPILAFGDSLTQRRSLASRWSTAAALPSCQIRWVWETR